MQFVKVDDLKIGMRLARPIYNKEGALLYERNSKITAQGVNSIKNFGLLGIFILEPAEPVPPMTDDDIAFERFQTMFVFSLREELIRILQTGKAQKIQAIAAVIIKEYGRLDRKVTFIQNLRSKEDFVYKHSLNIAMLCAMIGHAMNISPEEQQETVVAALVHDIGKLIVSDSIKDKEELTKQDQVMLDTAEVKGHEIVEEIFLGNPNIKRACKQCRKGLLLFKSGRDIDIKFITSAKILLVAEMYDKMTAMQLGTTPDSEVAAVKFLISNQAIFDRQVVKALIDSVNILYPGVCVELNNKVKGLVLASNDKEMLYPLILTFDNNKIIDLSNRRKYSDLEIEDIMKTLDNRHVMDVNILREYGF